MSSNGNLMLEQGFSLKQLQGYVAAIVKERGFDGDSIQDNFVMLAEEVGELAKALRKHNGVKLAADSANTDVKHEAADVLWMLICVCNKLNIDLDQAVREKEEKNKKRSWS